VTGGTTARLAADLRGMEGSSRFGPILLPRFREMGKPVKKAPEVPDTPPGLYRGWADEGWDVPVDPYGRLAADAP
jgi:hypothetical protein